MPSILATSPNLSPVRLGAILEREEVALNCDAVEPGA